MTLRLRGSTSQYVDITASPNAGDATLTLPTTTGTIRTTSPSGVDGDYTVATGATISGSTNVITFDTGVTTPIQVDSNGLTVATGATISGSTNVITASTNGIGRIHIDSDGQVAIGSDFTVASSILTIRDFPTDFDRFNGNGTAILNVQGGTTQGVGQIGGSICLSKVNSGRPGAVIAAVQTDSDVDRLGLSVYTHPSSTSSSTVVEQLRITHSGAIGIGTDNPEGVIHTLSSTNGHLILESPDSIADIIGADTGGSTRIRSSGGQLTFYTGGDASSHNAANSSTAATFNTSGNLVFPDGQGIDFSAVAGSGMETGGGVLDDYEAGTWTPQITQGITGTPSYSDQHGWYTKIGRIVTLYFYIQFASSGNTGSNTSFRVGNFPFPIASNYTTNRNRGMGVSNYHSIPGFTDANVSFYGAGSSNTHATLYQGNNGVATSSSLNSQYIIGGFEYISE